jgi:hypothetical protein
MEDRIIKRTFIILAFSFIIFSCSKETEKQIKISDSEQNITTLISVNDSKELESIIPYHKNKENGSAYFFDENVLSWKAEYQNGSLEGESILYFPSGRIKGILNYKDNKKVGLQTYYYENGNVREKQWGNTLGELEDFVKYKPDGTRDSTGLSVIITNTKENLKINEAHTIEIRLGNRISDDTYVMIGALPENEKALGLVDTVDVLTNDEYVFRYTFVPKVHGSDSITGKVEHIFFDEASTKVEEYTFKYGFNVVD